MLVLCTIVTCFICIIYHYYTFSGTNLLTRCHSASSLFSAVFYSRKVLLRIFSELHETKGQVPIFPAPSRSPKERRRRAPRWPNHTPARWAPWPRHPMVWAPRDSTDVAPSPIYCLRRENPKIRSQFPRRVPQRRRHRRQVSGDRISVPARRRDGELPPESSPSTPPPSSSPLLTPMMRRE